MNSWAWLEKLPQREHRIVILLENFMDVEHGLRDRTLGDDGVIGMCAAWNHPSYVQLRRLLPLMRDTREFDYWHVAERFIRCSSRRVLKCPRCHATEVASSAGFDDEGLSSRYHKHGRDGVLMVPFALKEWSRAVDPVVVKRGVHWLANRWHGEPFLPDELLARAA